MGLLHHSDRNVALVSSIVKIRRLTDLDKDAESISANTSLKTSYVKFEANCVAFTTENQNLQGTEKIWLT